MKISKEYLKRVIAEEISRTLSEGKKMKIAVKGKKKVDEIANVSSYNHDYLDREEPSSDQRWKDYLYQKEKEEYQKRKEEEERYQPAGEPSGDQSGYWNYSESMDPKKKSKKLDEYEYSDEKGVYGSSSPGHSSSPSYSGKTLSKKQRDDEEDDYREKKRGEKETKRKYQGDMSSGN